MNFNKGGVVLRFKISYNQYLIIPGLFAQISNR